MMDRRKPPAPHDAPARPAHFDGRKYLNANGPAGNGLWHVLRWAASSFLSAEQSFRRLSGYKDLWMLSAALGRNDAKREVQEEENCAIAA